MATPPAKKKKKKKNQYGFLRYYYYRQYYDKTKQVYKKHKTKPLACIEMFEHGLTASRASVKVGQNNCINLLSTSANVYTPSN